VVCSDAFGQKFGRVPTLVEGFANLYCMEIDANADTGDEGPDLGAAAAAAGGGGGGAGGGAARFMAAAPKEFKAISSFFKDMSGAIPGIDEMLSFTELMRHVQRMEFDVTVFDTAPTGHTLRLLSLPDMVDKAITKLLSLRERFGGLLNSVSGMMGAAGGAAGGGGVPSEQDIMGMLDEVKRTCARAASLSCRGRLSVAPRAVCSLCARHLLFCSRAIPCTSAARAAPARVLDSPTFTHNTHAACAPHARRDPQASSTPCRSASMTRAKRRSFACASPSFCHCTRRNGWSRS
jgi:hypothetical protein